jgi:general secretion pathway protein H
MTASHVRQRGFSLIEIVAVLFLIGLAIAVVTFSFSKTMSSAKIDAASRDLVAALRYTRGQAIVRGQQQAFDIDIEHNTYQAPGKPIMRLPKEMHLALTTAEIEQTGSTSGRIRFFPDGASTGGHITVFLGQRQWQINISWLTGQVVREEVASR